MFGSHLSVAGGVHLAVQEAVRLGLDCVQVFTKNQQQWKAPPLKDDAVRAWNDALRSAGWSAAARAVSHASYLINLGSPDPELHAKSMALMRDELDRCEALGIARLVFHPGAHTTDTREQGVARIAGACARLIADTRGYACALCLENVVGAGTTIGRTFEELADLRARIIQAGAPPQRVGFCIDTCHAHAAGYACDTPEKAQAVIDALLAALGPGAVRCLHVNDSLVPAGSRKDRHAHIGRGTIGVGGFGPWVRCPAFADLPKIMETPKEPAPDGQDWDLHNVRTLRALLTPGALPTPPETGTGPVKVKAPAANQGAKKKVAKVAKGVSKKKGTPARRARKPARRAP